MSDNPIANTPPTAAPTKIDEVLEGLEPMGDLDQFAIKDLTPQDEEEFFRILEDA